MVVILEWLHHTKRSTKGCSSKEATQRQCKGIEHNLKWLTKVWKEKEWSWKILFSKGTVGQAMRNLHKGSNTGLCRRSKGRYVREGRNNTKWTCSWRFQWTKCSWIKYTCVKINPCDIKCTYESNYDKYESAIIKSESSNQKEVYLVLNTIDPIEDEDNAPKESEDEEEVVVLERQLICALDEVEKPKKKNALLEELLEE